MHTITQSIHFVVSRGFYCLKYKKKRNVVFYQSNLRTTPHTNEYIEIPTYISNYIVFISTYIFDVLYEFDKYVHSYIKQINKKR